VSPRGVAIPDVQSQLFDAAEEILLRDGPHALTGRAITREAGCAAGLLHKHFGDLEQFLTQLIVRRFRIQAEGAAELPARAGGATVEDNLTEAALALFESRTLATAHLVIARPSLRPLVETALASGAPGLPEVTVSIATYLARETELGRVAESADCHSIALALVGTVHHLLLTSPSAGTPDTTVRRLVRALTVGVTTDAPR
jgi:AcrR family transcriptional regulator